MCVEERESVKDTNPDVIAGGSVRMGRRDRPKGGVEVIVEEDLWGGVGRLGEDSEEGEEREGEVRVSGGWV